MSRTDSNSRMIARQHAMTARLMGIDFLPVRMDAGEAYGARTSAAEPGASISDREEPVTNGVAKAAVSAPPAIRKTSANAHSRDEKARLLQDLHALHDKTCPHCSKITNYTQTVFGEGDPDAAIMFIGEAPGEEEDLSGRPFVGKAGQKLNEIIKAMGLQREDVYIANVLKARPPENRPPLPDEIAKCSPFLRDQIRIISPGVIVALGGPSSKLMLQTDIGITRLRGQWGTYADGELRIPIMPTFHPAYLLRNYTPKTRKEMWSDMQEVLERLKEPEG